MLPESWRLISLHELLVSLETGRRPKGGARGITDGVPSLSAEHIDAYGKFKLESLRYVPREYYEQMSNGRIRRNDILIVKDGATTGKTAFVDDAFSLAEAVVNEHVFLCRPDVDIVLPKYLFFWLWSSAGQYAIRLNYQGAAIGGINQRFANNVLVPIPPLSEQKGIAAILNEQMAAVEKARAAAQKQIEVTKLLPAAYLQSMFSSLQPRTWQKKRLSDVAKLLPSKSISSNGDTDVYAITTACLTESGFQPSGVKIARMWAQDKAQSKVMPGEILVARSNTPELVGRVAMFNGNPVNAVASDLLIRILPHNSVEATFLTAYLSFLYVSGYWKERAGGASGTMKKITRTQISNEQIPFPTYAEQKRIAATLNEQTAGAEKLRVKLGIQLDEINALPAALLRKAFNGEL